MPEAREVVDLFAGPGGWDVAADALGLAPLGVELDDSACATRGVAGLQTLQGDVAGLDPAEFVPLWGLIASPPCQAFSMAGAGHGRRALSAYEKAIGAMWERGEWAVDREWLDEQCDDPRGHLVIEPLRWAMALRPTWVVLEQVEPVLPLWEAMARVFREMGYSVWTGVLSAEQYGVPQTRKRAILIARRDGVEARRPPPTHKRFQPRDRRFQDEPTDGLFEMAVGRREHPEDRGLLPWISMAEALGWPATDIVRTGHNSMVTSRDPQDMVPYERPASAPAPTVKASALGAWKHGPAGSHVDPPMRWKSNDRPNAAVRGIDEPAPTITAGHDHNERVWLKAGTGEKEAVRSEDEPAPTLRFGERLNSVSWTHERPATTVNCDPRIAQPGHKGDVNGGEPGAIRQMEGSIRVTAEEAAVLQSFPPNYPWQGTRTKMFEQIGNAVPPLLALAILREVIS